jgi:hypothetical protein
MVLFRFRTRTRRSDADEATAPSAVGQVQAGLDVKDKTFTQAGKVGVWTKADSVTYFDDLAVEPR